eukprot:scaffold74300_cov56-Phaeocystis_antarctica.AAC.1
MATSPPVRRDLGRGGGRGRDHGAVNVRRAARVPCHAVAQQPVPYLHGLRRGVDHQRPAVAD